MVKGLIFFLALGMGLGAFYPPALYAEGSDLSGQLKYSYETNYVDAAASQQVFTQEYLTNLRGSVIEDRIGSYQLGLQYQRGTAELRNVNFSNTLNFRDALSVTTAYFRKDFSGLAYNYVPIADNRFSIAAVYRTPYLPSVTFGYETGDSKAASLEGVSRNDRKANIGLNYTIGGSSFSARYARSSLLDNTYLASAANLVSRDGIFTLNGSSSLGERAQVSGSYSDQTIYNQTGASVSYNQRLQNLSTGGNIRLTPFLALNPEFVQTTNEIDYAAPAGAKNHQQSRKLGIAAKIQPLRQAEFVFDAGAGEVELGDEAGERKQNLLSRRVGANFNFEKDFNVNLSLKNENYAGATSEGKVINLSGAVTFPLESGIKLTYKRDLTNYAGDVYTLSSSGSRNQDLNEWGLGLNLPNGFYFEGGVSFAEVNTYSYRNESAGLKYATQALANFEVKRENRYGNEAAQTIRSQTDTFKAGFPLGGATVSEQLSLIRTRSSANAAEQDLTGFKNVTEVNYAFGDSTVALNLNSERRDQNSSAYSRAFLSFTRSY